ncbi:MAG: riboflavin biosynthesis protein RibD [Candidatus Fluviicola riflensis]|nr:MAG: riboflavin biosynthesis protein RibD [Candidatus Fluviicola riflensis]OGS79447.1 MAG: riboflavin biosynthesis protein RibD [Candidatus Fluviicola riflensis]OGS87259.1 MAG: riboflavin biosynthesis protein RibD [Fluviicola sp. RIFCSPHIGHO2_01_FULL_43_53]OGS89669.1 MAG: riboflavin biosynthesis protein RibD [Fluviicola sp. RIFCSPHIGHO2_12_FULL_43_24]
MFSDEQFMRRAIQLALLGGVSVAPNPMVGAVIVHNNRIIGEGYHQVFGSAHAEVNAVNAVEDQSLLSESTIYVTLEPCAHFGKTPPCANLLVEKQFKRVVIGTIDPFAKVAGQGIKILQEAGIDCTVGVLEAECQEINKRFFTFHQQQRPYIVLKWAQTIDGFIDAERNNNETGEIRWISSPDTQTLVHQWRAEEQAILVGWKTILNDNPSLTVRAVSGKNPIRIIVDSQLQAPKTAIVFTDGLLTIVFNTVRDDHQDSVQYIQLSDCTVESQLKALYQLNIISVFIEGGNYTLQQYIDSGNWDEARVIVGENRFGSGIKAPVIGQIPASTHTFSTDTIHTFTRS